MHGAYVELEAQREIELVALAGRLDLRVLEAGSIATPAPDHVLGHGWRRRVECHERRASPFDSLFLLFRCGRAPSLGRTARVQRVLPCTSLYLPLHRHELCALTDILDPLNFQSFGALHIFSKIR